MLDNLIIIIIVGIIAGWVASRILGRKRSYGLLGNLVVGVVGAFLGAYIFEFIGLPTTNIISTLLMAIVGSVALLYIIRLIKQL